MPTGRALAAIALVLATSCTSSESDEPKSPVPSNWRLVFHDDFDGSRLDADRWTTCYDWNVEGCTNSGNPEQQWYLPGQVSVRDGAAVLTAERRSVRAYDGKTYPWVSGMISTGRDHWDAHPRRTFTYGYFEASIRIAPQEGMFPAFWMMPASRYTPPELDIMEFFGNTQRVDMYTHWRGRDGADEQQAGHHGPVDYPAEYHTFALLWKADVLTWYVDDVKRFQVTAPERVPHVPMELLINLAVGVPKSPPPSVNSAEMKVDSVRVWQP
ncbi:family 16 glycosylhydrolase [Streptomyces sp. NPDC006365]|uniref:glycoside hydrolase family 16 protein n=1 Tax=Streptomyces sp. NPDC006365 TaxID=3364744 RepID=UPI0036737FCC